MALDGVTIAALVAECNDILLNQRISKIAQPEKNEILFTFKGIKGNNRLLISANPTLPFMYMTGENKTSPQVAPNFCMLLRKHIGNGRITEISQPSLERVIKFKIEHLDELGDPAVKYLYIELMGKHSNIIFCNSDNVIIDSIKHISAQVSSVREVLPNREYFIPTQEGKISLLDMTEDDFYQMIATKPTSLCKAIYQNIIGISPLIAQEIAYRAGLDGDVVTASLDDSQKEAWKNELFNLIHIIKEKRFQMYVYYDMENDKPIDFAPIKLTMYNDYEEVEAQSISQVLISFYAQKNKYTNIHQKSTDLRKIIAIHLDRDRKKYQLQKKQLQDTNKKDKYKIYGEMLHTYGYMANPGDKSITVTNYYDDSKLDIPLDPTISAMDNAKKYFDKYNKLKRTSEALSEYIVETENEIQLLESIETSLTFAENDADLNAIKEELSNYGFIKKHYNKKKQRQEKSNPLHFVDKNGFHIYVGKNNYQNDQLTFKFANGGDWWFHAKQAPGSHVIVKTEGKELPDDTYEIAAAVAAYYSSLSDSEKVEVDYLQRKNVKKPNGAASGFVVYYTNYSMMATPSIDNLTRID
ncbi:MAG: NFACT family protein [Lachnospiraceae bacterium]|nr:NFACT family protein [Lachnospiraceae bacterium]